MGFGLYGQLRKLNLSRQQAWHGYHFASVHDKLKAYFGSWVRFGFIQDVITVRSFTRNDHPAKVLFGVPDGVFPPDKRPLELDPIRLAVKRFWDNGYSYAWRHLLPPQL